MSKRPMVHQRSVWGTIIVASVLLFCTLAAIQFTGPENRLIAFILTAVILYSYTLLAKYTLLSDFVKGAKHFQKGDYKSAIEFYKKGLDFFTKRSYIDKYRYLILLNPTKLQLREIAMINIASCSAQLGDGKTAKEYYEKTLELYPQSVIAKAALNAAATYEKLGREDASQSENKDA